MWVEDILTVIGSDSLLSALGLAGMLLPGLMAMGAGCVAVLTALSFRKTNKVFADKLAKQITEFGMLVLGVWLLLISVRWGLWVGAIWPASDALQEFYRLFFDLPGRTAMAGTLLSIVVVRAWRRDKRSSAAHYVLGGFASLAWMAALMLFVVGGLESGRAWSAAQKMNVSALQLHLSGPVAWLIWVQALFLSMALAGGAGLLYLVLRRNREDYGRDYYGWAIRTCARRALSSGVVQAVWAVAVCLALTLPWINLALQEPVQWLRTLPTTVTSFDALATMTVYFCLCLAAWACLLPLIRHQNPMRLKGLMLAHVLIMLTATVLLVQVYLGMLPR